MANAIVSASGFRRVAETSIDQPGGRLSGAFPASGQVISDPGEVAFIHAFRALTLYARQAFLSRLESELTGPGQERARQIVRRLLANLGGLRGVL